METTATETKGTRAVTPQCSCGRKLSPLPFNESATTVHRRTCRGCRQLWFIKCEPSRTKVGWRHILTLRPVLIYCADCGTEESGIHFAVCGHKRAETPDLDNDRRETHRIANGEN